MGQAEGDGGYGGGGVVAYALEFFKLLEIGGELPAVLLHHLPCAFVQVAGTRVVAEPLPLLQHLFL